MDLSEGVRARDQPECFGLSRLEAQNLGLRVGCLECRVYKGLRLRVWETTKKNITSCWLGASLCALHGVRNLCIAVQHRSEYLQGHGLRLDTPTAAPHKESILASLCSLLNWLEHKDEIS